VPSLIPRHCRPPGPILNRARRLVPVRPDVHALATALAALHAQRKGRDLGVVGVIVRADDGLMAARLVEAIDGKPAHALPAHICQVHRRAGFVLALGHGVLVWACSRLRLACAGEYCATDDVNVYFSSESVKAAPEVIQQRVRCRVIFKPNNGFGSVRGDRN
jgi:hypothetical protein